jgi:PhoH-like ATPase
MVWGIKARNKEQRFALDLLLDPEVPLVTLTGGAGTGKTLLAIAAALEQVVERSLYRRVLVTRPIMPVGADIGFLPGEKAEKLKPWMQPIYDNLDFLSRMEDEQVQSADVIAGLLQRDMLEVEALTYIRGRTLPKQFIIIDEAQNLTPHMIKTLVTRVGDHSKFVFTGDLYQIDNPYLDATSSGLAYLIEKFKGQEAAGHITLLKGERSRLAELGAQLL